MNDKLQPDEPLPPDTVVPVRSRNQRIAATVIIVSVLIFGWFVSRSLLNSKLQVNRRKPAEMKTAVQLQQLLAADLALEVEAMGTVIAAEELDLKPRVSGRVIEVNPKLIPGSQLNRDDIILKIDTKAGIARNPMNR